MIVDISALLTNIDIDIENIDHGCDKDNPKNIDIDKNILENIDIDKNILENIDFNIDIDKDITENMEESFGKKNYSFSRFVFFMLFD